MGLTNKFMRKILLDDLNKALEDGIVFLYEGVVMSYNNGKYYTSFYLSESGMNINDYEPYPLDIDYMDTDELKAFTNSVKKQRISLNVQIVNKKSGEGIRDVKVDELLPI